MKNSKLQLSVILGFAFLLILSFSLMGVAQEETILRTQVFAHCGPAGWGVQGWFPGAACAVLKEPVYETLTKQELNREKKSWSIVPGLAKEWDHSKDLKTWTFHLREGVKWHDGEAFTAEDVKYTMDMYLHPEVMGVYGSDLSAVLKGYKTYEKGEASTISGVKVVDKNTVKFETKTPQPTLDYILHYIPIVPEHRFSDIPMSEVPSSSKWKKPVGTGPFQFVKEKEGEFRMLKAFDDYYRGKPKIDKWIAYSGNSPSAKLSRAKKGKVDLTRFCVRAVGKAKADQIESLEDKGYKVTSDPSYLTTMLTINPDSELMTLPVRKAILYAIDTEKLTQVLPLVTPWNVFGIGNTKSEIAEKYEYNPEKAKELLEKANWNSSTTIQLISAYQGTAIKRTLALIAQMLDEVGIDVEIAQTDIATHYKRFHETTQAELNMDATLLKPPLKWLEWIRQSYLYPKGENPGYYLPELTALGEKVGQLAPGKERTSLAKAAQILMAEKAYMAPLYLQNEVMVLSDRVYTGKGTAANHGIHIGREYHFYDWSIKE